MSVAFHGVINTNAVYTAKELRQVLNISEAQLLEYFKDGLRYSQRTRKHPRLITGLEFHRFTERTSRTWDDAEDDAPE